MRKLAIFIIILLILVLGFLLAAIYVAAGDNGETITEEIDYGTVEVEVSTDTGTEKIELDLSDWKLKLVNSTHLLAANFEVATVEADEGYLFDERAAEPLREMLEAGRAAGHDLHICSAWRSYEYQEMLFENKVERVMAEQGIEREEAEEIAGTEVANPGMSEHCLGLAVDIITSEYTDLDEGFAETEAAKWLAENCADFGFVLRYPEGKEEITGIIYEPWHFRYVGTEAAEYMMAEGLTLEELWEEAK